MVSLFALYQNLRQKRLEHRAAFYHAVVVENCMEDVLSFHSELYDLAENELPKVKASQDIGEIRRLMQQISSKTRVTARKVSVLVRPFDQSLEQQVLATFDEIRDQTTQWVGGQIADQPSESLARLGTMIADSQTRVVSLLRDGEFNQGWPSALLYLRKARLALVALLSSRAANR
jgi:uncharacterized protein YecA (UPF0149 family)